MRAAVRFFALALLVSPLTVATAQPAPVPPACAAPAALPAALSGWATPVPLTAATTAETLGAAGLVPGRAVRARLAPTPEIQYPVRPEKPGGSVSHGGLFEFTVTTAGTYRVALGSGAWIDLLDGATPLTSVAHGHGPDCSGIRKMVDFALKPGHYRLQVAGNGTPELLLMVTQLS